MNLLDSTVSSVNNVHTHYLLFALTVTVMILFAYNQSQELKEIFMFCLGGFFTYINNDKKL